MARADSASYSGEELCEVQSHPACLPTRSFEEFFHEVIPVMSRDKTQLEKYTTA